MFAVKFRCNVSSQHLLVEQERLEREVEHEVAVAMKRSAEEENNTDLLHNTHTDIQVSAAVLYGASLLILTCCMTAHALHALMHLSNSHFSPAYL